jgi:hypothetical protein
MSELACLTRFPPVVLRQNSVQRNFSCFQWIFREILEQPTKYDWLLSPPQNIDANSQAAAADPAYFAPGTNLTSPAGQ